MEQEHGKAGSSSAGQEFFSLPVFYGTKSSLHTYEIQMSYTTYQFKLHLHCPLTLTLSSITSQR
jgi:hypothetical protein